MTFLAFLFIVVFLIGLYFYAKNGESREGFSNNESRCPNMLIQDGSKFYLYNSKLAKVPGVNPIEFNNLEEYTEFLDWQRSQNIRCPVLYLQNTYDTQGNSVYKVRPSVSEPQSGLPPSISVNQSVPPPLPTSSLLVDASHDDKPYNKNSFPGYDASSYYIGQNTPLDNMNTVQENKAISPDPMDPNWGGADYTQTLVNKGYYKDDEVSIYVS
jgi:hypothetical protein